MFDKQLMSIPGVKGLITKLSCLAIFQSLAIVLEAYFLSVAVVNTWSLKKITALLLPMLYFFIAFVIRYLITRIENQLTNQFATEATDRIKNQLLTKEFELGPRMVSKIGSGHLITLALEGIDKIENYFNLIILKTVNMSIIPVILLIAIFCINFISGITLLLVFPIIIIFMIILGLAAQAKAARQYKGFTDMSNNFVDTMRGLKTLKLFGLSDKYADNLYRVSENYRKSTISVLKVALLSTFALDFFTTISIAIVAVFLGVALIDGKIALLPALTVLVLAPDYFLPVRDYGDDYHATLDGKNALSNIFEILKIKSPSSNVKLNSFNGWNNNSNLKVTNLNYSYDKKDSTLKNINFNVTGYKKIGIVGRSGSGKSTLLNVLCGWLEPSNAKDLPFEIGTEKIDSLAQIEWQKHISYIPQNPYIFTGTIAENIAFYQPDATKQQIQSAAEKAGLMNFIKDLPAGFETRIGESGRGISGGQAQRIALARTLLDDNREIMLLDEPTAHLDIETEYDLKETMLPIFQNHLVIFATHRLHWMQNMDYILVMDDGKVVEQGTPAELINKKGLYQSLVNEIRGENQNA